MPSWSLSWSQAMYLQCRRKGGGTPRRKGDFRALAVEMPRLDDLARGYRGRLDWCTLLLPWRFHGEGTYRPVRPVPTLPEVVPAAS